MFLAGSEKAQMDRFIVVELSDMVHALFEPIMDGDAMEILAVVAAQCMSGFLEPHFGFTSLMCGQNELS